MQRHNYCIIIPIRINQTSQAPFSSRTPLPQISFPDQTSPNLLNFKTIAKTDSEGSPRGLSSFFNLLPVYPLLSAGPLRNAASSPWKGRSTGGEYRQRAIVIRHATRPYKDRPLCLPALWEGDRGKVRGKNRSTKATDGIFEESQEESHMSVSEGEKKVFWWQAGEAPQTQTLDWVITRKSARPRQPFHLKSSAAPSPCTVQTLSGL